MKRTVADRIRMLRLGKRITQVQLAEACGYDQTTISDVESGRNTRLETVNKIADVLREMPEQPRKARSRRAA